MKVNRHAKIIELISKFQIETQEELADHLNKEGFKRLSEDKKVNFEVISDEDTT